MNFEYDECWIMNFFLIGASQLYRMVGFIVHICMYVKNTIWSILLPPTSLSLSLHSNGRILSWHLFFSPLVSTYEEKHMILFSLILAYFAQNCGLQLVHFSAKKLHIYIPCSTYCYLHSWWLERQCLSSSVVVQQMLYKSS